MDQPLAGLGGAAMGEVLEETATGAGGRLCSNSLAAAATQLLRLNHTKNNNKQHHPYY